MPNTIRFLFLPGGGIWGAIQPIALRKLLPKKYNHIYGCSIGAMNGAYLSQYNSNDIYNSTISLEKMWQDVHSNVSSSAYYNFSTYNPIRVFKSSLHSDKIIKNIVSEYLPKINSYSYSNNTPVFHCPVANVETGHTEIHNNCPSLYGYISDIKPYIIASASLPIILPFSRINGKIYSDGGIFPHLSKFPIEKLSQGYDKIEIDIVHNKPKGYTVHIPENEYDVNIGFNALNLIRLFSSVNQKQDEKKLIKKARKSHKPITITNTYIKDTEEYRRLLDIKTYSFNTETVRSIQNLEIDVIVEEYACSN